MKRRQNLFKQEQGFTLIELMAVLAILTMLVLIAVPAIGSITKKAEAQADDATISMIEKAGGLALLGDVAYDDPEEEQYEVATLVEKGYLDIDESHKYAGSGNAVTRVKGYEFEFGFEERPEPTPVGFFTWVPVTGGVQITGYTGDAVDVVIPEEIDGMLTVSIGKAAFASTAIETVFIPDSVETIGQSAFFNNSLKRVVLSSGLKHIDSAAFYANTELKTITIPETVETIGDQAFMSTSLIDIKLPSSLNSIGNYAFANTALETVTIPASVKTMGVDVFDADVTVNPE